jgi:hypothetical protein
MRGRGGGGTYIASDRVAPGAPAACPARQLVGEGKGRGPAADAGEGTSARGGPSAIPIETPPLALS